MEASVPRVDAGAAPLPRPRRGRVVLIGAVALVVVVAVVAATAYLGLGPFARAPGPPGGNGGGTNPCAGAAFFSVVAAVGGTLTFNGTTPGPAMTVGNQTTVCVKLSVDPAAGVTHSFKIVAFSGTASSPTAFPGANTTDPTIGTQPGASQTIRFVASPAGAYKYLCAVDGHAATMWGYFNVTA
jgi:hypothetical protein